MIGEARLPAALVVNRGGVKTAILGAVVVRALRSDREGLQFNGDVQVGRSERKHLRRVVLPFVQQVLDGLGVGSVRFEVEFATPELASVLGKRVVIEGNSADLPSAVGMLAASLGFRLPANVLMTGVLKDRSGRIGMVICLHEKFRAAAEAPPIKRVICPALDSDHSIRAVLPECCEELATSLAQARLELEVMEVNHVLDALKDLVDQAERIRAALKGGWFEPEVDADSVSETACWLGTDHDRAYREVFRDSLCDSDLLDAKLLWELWVRDAVIKGAFPEASIRSTHGLLLTLPPAVRRRLRFHSPFDERLSLELAKFAAPNQAEGVRILFGLGSVFEKAISTRRVSEVDADRSVAATVKRVLQEIDPHCLEREIGTPIREARARFSLPCNQVSDEVEFFGIVEAFLAQVLGSLGEWRGGEAGELVPEALQVVERACERDGGVEGALRDALDPVRGGLMGILGRCTEWLIEERKRNKVRSVFLEAVDPFDFETQTQIAKVMLQQLRLELPAEIADTAPEVIAKNWSRLAETVARGRAECVQLLRMS